MKYRYKKIKVSFALLEAILRGKFENAKAEGLPENFKIVRVNDHQGFGTTFCIVIESDEFEELEEGKAIPVLPVSYQK